MKPTKQAVYSSRTADKFVVRLPDDMREAIAEIARKHHRSMNSQIVSWMEICVELEENGIAVTRDSLMYAAKHLQEESEVSLPSDLPIVNMPLIHDGKIWILEAYVFQGGELSVKLGRVDSEYAYRDKVVKVAALTGK